MATEEPQSSQQVADPEEFNQQRRLRSIHEARDRCREVYEVTQDPTQSSDGGAIAAAYRAAVENYVGEIEGLLRRYDWDDDESNLWTGKEIGTVTLRPPAELRELQRSDGVTVIDDEGMEPEEIAITGLRDYMDAQPPFRHRFWIRVRQRHKGTREITGAAVSEMPVNLSYQAFRYANDFLARVGFDVEIESSEHRAVVDEELMEEYERWKRENLNQN